MVCSLSREREREREQAGGGFTVFGYPHDVGSGPHCIKQALALYAKK